MSERPAFYGRMTTAGLVVGFAIATAGILNAFPSPFGLPTPGPYPPIILRPAIFFACVLIFVLTKPWAAELEPRLGTTGRAIGAAADLAVLAMMALACWRFNEVMSILDQTLYFFSTGDAWIATGAALSIVYLCWRAWGAPLAIVALTLLIFFFTSDHWPGFLNRVPPDFTEGASTTLWFGLASGILGSITATMILTVFVFIVFGQMLEGTGAGMSLIRVAFRLTRHLKGGPAHAAIVSSGLFGTMSGNAVANVVGTGVLTIPMMKKNGFPPHFAGAVEATSSSAGQIMPPVMGAAALVLADFVGETYLTVITAALIPALLYYLSLFSAVVFEARKLNIGRSPELSKEMEMERQDILNLAMVFVPVFVMILCLKLGMSAAGGGIFALLSNAILSFINPEIRKEPMKLVKSFASGGVAFAHMMMAVGVIGIVVSVLGATGLPTDFANMVSRIADGALFWTLLAAMAAALVLGMGMPTLPAYLTIALILGPTLRQFGLSDLSLHLFVLYYGVASSITPPVAITAYAAAAIAKSPPLKTSIYAYRVGLVKFIVPFIFVYNPVLLLVDEGGFDTTELITVLFRTVLAIFLLSSSLAGFDRMRLHPAEIALRVATALGCLWTVPMIHWGATAIGLATFAIHWMRARQPEAENA
ncbi:TRAP transporter fused permease subunit [Mameliella alba]|nr:TRAP transporter fused permease subunit [Mameliella alba]MBY6169625.1 TRAP transporter fused permease subunit [Mameliella alba]MBY6174644.1 TRAP transporter fused permease subunit [Mameliella alba]